MPPTHNIQQEEQEYFHKLRVTGRFTAHKKLIIQKAVIWNEAVRSYRSTFIKLVLSTAVVRASIYQVGQKEIKSDSPPEEAHKNIFF